MQLAGLCYTKKEKKEFLKRRDIGQQKKLRFIQRGFKIHKK